MTDPTAEDQLMFKVAGKVLGKAIVDLVDGLAQKLNARSRWGVYFFVVEIGPDAAPITDGKVLNCSGSNILPTPDLITIIRAQVAALEAVLHGKQPKGGDPPS